MKAKVWLRYAILAMILGLGLVLRTYNFEKSFYFAHDQDLYSWIAKDIVVNHHQRLVGQVTSVDGVFIGSAYYYLMALFYKFGEMNPLVAYMPLTILGLFSIGSIFWVIKQSFSVRSAYIGAFIYAISFGIASYDRWSVPTQPTLLWSIWFVGVILGLYKGNLKYLPLYGFLSGWVWQLHIALIPILPMPIVAHIVGKNNLKLLWTKGNIKMVIVSVVIFAISLSPFLMFELKHNFSQIKSMVVGINKNTGGLTGIAKLNKVIDASGREFQQRLWVGDYVKWDIVFWIVLIIASFGVVQKKRKKNSLMGLFGLWYFLILWAQFASKRVVSEYYFTNLIPIYIVVVSVFIDYYFKNLLLAILAFVYLIINLFWLITKSDYDESYYYRRQVVEYIKADVARKQYSCVAVNFIADPGVGVGFRYLFWYYGIELVKPGTPGVPVYNIPIPWQLSVDEEPVHFGRFGVILPVKVDTLINPDDCRKPEYQLDPLLGYTE